ncbi:MAG: alpha/beta hydrolase [Bacteroidota bacterium]
MTWIGCFGLIALFACQAIERSSGPNYLFYLHGGIVSHQGDLAVSPYYGVYLYQDILDSLASRGFEVISEIRPADIDEVDYAKQLVQQINRLKQLGVASDQIHIVGASLGAYIALETAILLDGPAIQYALLGLCSDYAVGYFSDFRQDITGTILSIYEASDQKGSCAAVFLPGEGDYTFQEVQVNTGLDHGFLYQPYPEWLDPLTGWLHQKSE